MNPYVRYYKVVVYLKAPFRKPEYRVAVISSTAEISTDNLHHPLVRSILIDRFLLNYHGPQFEITGNPIAGWTKTQEGEKIRLTITRWLSRKCQEIDPDKIVREISEIELRLDDVLIQRVGGGNPFLALMRD